MSKVGSDAPPYRLDTRYNVAAVGGADNGDPAVQRLLRSELPVPRQNGVPATSRATRSAIRISGRSRTVETEVGLELRLLEGKVRTNVSYYDKKSYDQIFSVPSSAATGYTSITRNAGDLRNKGIEVSVNTQPVRTRNLHVGCARPTGRRNRVEVIDLAPGVHLALPGRLLLAAASGSWKATPTA